MNETRDTRGRGQAMVEFAVVLPVVVLLLLALFDAGRAVILYTELTNTARVAARVAIVNQSNDAGCAGPERTFKCAALQQSTSIDLAPEDIPDLVVSGGDCALPSDCTATVSLAYTFQPVTPVMSLIIRSISLTASETMPIERTYANP